MKRLAEWVERNFTLAFWTAFAVLMLLAWFNRFVQDDGFIVFRYAEHFARGLGLVFNPGERVEGYTCFLYAVLMAAGFKLGAEPVTWSYAIGLTAYAASLAATLRLGTLASGDRRIGLLAMILAGTFFSFSAYATGGLETSLETALVSWALVAGVTEALAERPTLGRRVGFSVLAALALLTRLDAVLVLLPVGAWLLAAPRGALSLRGILPLVLPAALLLGPWFAWKQAYYGDLLPATFYAKAQGGQSLGQGLLYVYRFVTSYWLAGPLLFAAWGWRHVLAGRAAPVLAVALLIVPLYVVAIGGDFMEFRLLVPVLPVLALIFARTAVWLEARGGLAAPFVLLFLAGSLHHAMVYGGTSHHGNESVQHLAGHLEQSHQNWIGIGRTLAREFHDDPGLVISTTAAGAIPFYSRAITVDQLGLTDPDVTRHGIAVPERMAGHRHMASMDQLMARRVNLIVGHPQMFHPPSQGALPDTIYQEEHPVPRWLAGEARGTPVPPGLRAIEIPIEHGWVLLALYLTPRPSVDAAIARHGWRVHPVASRAASAPAGPSGPALP